MKELIRAIFLILACACLMMACGGKIQENQLRIVTKSWTERARVASLPQEQNSGQAYLHAILLKTGTPIQMRLPRECGDSFEVGSEVSVLYEQLNSVNGSVADAPDEPDVILTMRCEKELRIGPD